MSTRVARLDHALILVPDLAVARAVFRRLGFSVGPLGRHTRFGTGNHVATFRHDYLELIGVLEVRPETAAMHERARTRPGLAGFALATSDAQGDAANLRAAGILVGDAVDFERPVDVDGVARSARFRCARIAEHSVDGLMVFYCQHLTRDHVWRHDAEPHENGAVAVAGAVYVADAPESCERALSAALGPGLWSTDRALIEYRLDGATVTIARRDAAALAWWRQTPRSPRSDALLAFVTKDAAQTERVLRGNAVPYARDDRGVWIHGTHALNTDIVFLADVEGLHADWSRNR